MFLGFRIAKAAFNRVRLKWCSGPQQQGALGDLLAPQRQRADLIGERHAAHGHVEGDDFLLLRAGGLTHPGCQSCC